MIQPSVRSVRIRTSCRPEPEVSEALEEGLGVLLGELQIGLSELEELAAGTKAMERQRRIDPGAEHHSQTGGQVPDQVVERLEHVSSVDVMQIVQDQRDRPVEIADVGGERLRRREWRPVPGVDDPVERLDADAGLVTLHRGDEVGPEMNRVVVE